MRRPQDTDVGAQEGPVATEPAAVEEKRRRSPGGNALIRLLQMLESAGYAETAENTVEAAVDEEGRDQFETLAMQFSAAPPGVAGYDRAAVAALSSEHREATVRDIASAYLEVANQMGPPTPDGPQWRSLGPWTIPNGQTYGASRVNVSGRVSALAVDPHNPAHVLAGAANGGVWESFDRGGSWAPRTDFAPTLAVGALAFDPSDPSTVYCGTGEGDWWSFLGAGVLRSTDGGTTWSVLCTAPFVGQGFYDVLVDPADGRHLLAGTTGGLYVSTDGGVTWTRERTPMTWTVSMAPGGGPSAEILASCKDGLWRSTDGGATWSAVALPGSPAVFCRLAVAITPSNPAIAYAWGATSSTASLWRRAGGMWTAVSQLPNVDVGQAWYDWFLAVAPDQDTQIYCGAIDVHRGDLSGTSWHWRNLTNKGYFGDSIHPDQHAIAFEPGQPGTLYVGNDGGVYQSPDRGITWQHCNNGLVITEFEYLAQDYGSSRWLIGGTQDNGTDRWTGSHSWDHVADGDGGDCSVNRTDPRIVFHTFQRGQTQPLRPERSNTRGDFGSWSRVYPPTHSGESSLFYPPVECSATGGDTIAIGGDALYVSRNNGSAWTRCGFPSAARSSALHIPDADNVYVGTTNGRVLRTQWTGSSWTALSAVTTPRSSAVVSDLYVDPNNLLRMWATYRTVGGGRVFVSDNGGSSWTDRTAGLPSLPINAIAVDTLNRDRLWVAADLGVYETRDGGLSWTDFANGLPNMYVGDLLFHPHARVLRAATRNRGVWEIPVDGWMTSPICGRQWTGTLTGNQTRCWTTHSWPATWHVVWTVMPTTPRQGDPQVSWDVQVERTDAEFVTYWITVSNLTADPVTFEGRYCILSRY